MLYGIVDANFIYRAMESGCGKGYKSVGVE